MNAKRPHRTPQSKYPCPLCGTASTEFFDNSFFLCPACEGIFRDPELFLPPDTERARYEQHNNDPADPRYRAFVSPLVEAITAHMPPGSHGLDFGAGPGPVGSVMLAEQGYQTACYDPYFHNTPGLLENTYDFVFCSEVIEHFYAPAVEFPRLFSLLRPGGSLFCMTHLYSSDIDFCSWYYKNDETHVFFYREQTMEFISRLFGFSACTINRRIIRLDTPQAAPEKTRVRA